MRFLAANVFAALCFASQAHALCIYRKYPEGLYTKTTIEQEFRDSAVVVRGTVLRSDYKPQPDTSGRDSGLLYEVRTDEVLKGDVPARFTYFSERNSGGFYLDKGTQYLLFLNPMSHDDPDQDVAPNSLVVNYNCGQSGPWSKIPAKDQEQLRQLASPLR